MLPLRCNFTATNVLLIFCTIAISPLCPVLPFVMIRTVSPMANVSPVALMNGLFLCLPVIRLLRDGGGLLWSSEPSASISLDTVCCCSRFNRWKFLTISSMLLMYFFANFTWLLLVVSLWETLFQNLCP